MMSDIVGHGKIISFLRNLIASERVPHALLFTGKRGIGKYRVALYTAMMYLCESRTACGECKSCRSVMKGVHEDFMVVEVPEGKKNIPIEDIRGLKEWAYMGASKNGKVAIIDNAHLMSQEAANAFLKTLEEPPIGTLFILITPSPYKLLQTVVSRCLVVRFSPLSVEEIEKICDLIGVKGKKRELCLMGSSLYFSGFEDSTINRAFDIVERFEKGDYSLFVGIDELKDEKLMELVLFLIRYRLNKRLREKVDKRLFDLHRELALIERMFYWSNVNYSSLFEYLLLKVAV